MKMKIRLEPGDRNLSGATTLGQSRPGSDGNEMVLYIPQSSNITATSSLDCLMSYSGYSLREGSYPLQKRVRFILQLLKTFLKTNESVIVTKRAFSAHLMLRWFDTVPNRKSILQLVEIFRREDTIWRMLF